MEAQFTAPRFFTLDGTDHATPTERGSTIRRYIIWRSRHADDQCLRTVVERAKRCIAALAPWIEYYNTRRRHARSRATPGQPAFTT